ncbi:MAG: metal ABC transporter substrate-binding protein [Verrucomicrobiia bacterium]
MQLKIIAINIYESDMLQFIPIIRKNSHKTLLIKIKILKPIILLTAFIQLFITTSPTLFSATPHTREKKLIITSIYPIFIITTNLVKGTDSFSVQNLIATGASPHDYQFQPEDIKKIQKADLILSTGLGIDDWLIEASKRLFPNKVSNCKNISKSLENRLIKIDSDNSDRSNKFNPHFWLDPSLMICAASNIAELLVELESHQRDTVYRNLAAFTAQMNELDLKISKELARLKNRSVIVKHNAYDYFARRYNIRIAAVVEESHEMPISPQHLSKLITLGRQNKIGAVFGETGGSNTIEKRIAEELNIPFAVLDPIESGDLSPESYIEKMLNNVEVLTRTLK